MASSTLLVPNLPQYSLFGVDFVPPFGVDSVYVVPVANLQIWRSKNTGLHCAEIKNNRILVKVSTQPRIPKVVADDTGRIAMYEECTEGSDGSDAVLTRYIYSNHLGSASLELDGSGEIISYEEYHPYGTTAYQAESTDINAVAKRYRYTGKERDEETGLYYHGARYYIPWLAGGVVLTR